MASDRPSADFDADIARVARAARLIIIGFWCAAVAAVGAIVYLTLVWLPHHTG